MASPQDLSWRDTGLRFHSLNHFFRRKFGHPVWKVTVDGGFACPNVDGTVGTGGCIFCNLASYSPARRHAPIPIRRQIDQGCRRLRRRYRAEHFVAYFQPGTNTYAPVQRLHELWTQAVTHPNIVGLIVGTRPDCAGDDVLDLLAEFARKTWVLIEYGLQTVHDRSLAWLNRGHAYDHFLDAVRRTRRHGLPIAAHVILGLPGETPDQMLATAGELARLRIDSVKLHNLYVPPDTPLAEMLAGGTLHLPDQATYVRYVVDFLERLPPDCVVSRLSADAPAQYVLAPGWCLDKSAVRMAIEAELARRDTWQGRRFAP